MSLDSDQCQARAVGVESVRVGTGIQTDQAMNRLRAWLADRLHNRIEHARVWCADRLSEIIELARLWLTQIRP